MSAQTGLAITGLLGLVYGMAVAFGPRGGGSDRFWRRFQIIGAFALLVALVCLAGIPYLMGAA